MVVLNQFIFFRNMNGPFISTNTKVYFIAEAIGFVLRNTLHRKRSARALTMTHTCWFNIMHFAGDRIFFLLLYKILLWNKLMSPLS